jgi:hypothetical protein
MGHDHIRLQKQQSIGVKLRNEVFKTSQKMWNIKQHESPNEKLTSNHVKP